jgi:hypothetical protein
MMALLLTLLLLAEVPPLPDFVPGSLVDEVDGQFEIEAVGCSPGVLRTVQSARGETDEGLDVAEPVVVEGELVVIRHPARGEFRGFVELRITGARRVE